jgi:hypothetical protein
MRKYDTHSHREALKTAWVVGWDSCLTSSRCPYGRRDFQDYWQAGFDACKAGKPFPEHMRANVKRANKAWSRLFPTRAIFPAVVNQSNVELPE